MASFNDILRQAPQHDAFSAATTWAFQQMLQALQAQVVGNHDALEEELVEQLNADFANRLVVHLVFDVLFDSDECCSAEVLSLDGTPILLFKRIGDKNDYSDGLCILDAQGARTLLGAVLSVRTQQALDRIGSKEPTTDTAALWRDVQYLVPASPTIFSVASPKSALGFAHCFDKHRAFVVQDQGRVLEVTGFKGWANKKRAWAGDADAHDATVATPEGDRMVDARNVLFSLADDPQELSQVAAAIAASDSWKAEGCSDFSGDMVGLHICQHHQGWVPKIEHFVCFKSRVVAHAALQVLKTPRPGLFKTDHPALAAFADHIDWSVSTVSNG